MTDHEIKQSLVDEFILERLSQYERFFNSPLWKKSFHPYLKALYEMAIRSTLQGSDHMTIDVHRGRALAFEALLNMPKFIEKLISDKTNPSSTHPEAKLSGSITDYLDDFPELHHE